MGEHATLCRVGVHMWEEPPISGTKGSGTVFFGGCNLRCRFCQNNNISQCITKGVEVTDRQLADVFLYLNDSGVVNINLVTPQHVLPNVRNALNMVKHRLTIPVVYNTNSYEYAHQLATLDGLVDVYLPDLKYCSSILSQRYSGVSDYFDIATKAICEMKRQQFNDVFCDGIMTKGVIIRHLVLPQATEDSKLVLDWIASNYPDCYVSLMAQYFPTHNDTVCRELNSKVSKRQYNNVVEYFFNVGLTNGFCQDADSATQDYVPDFDTKQVEKLLQQIQAKFGSE